ncbi:MAG: putative reactivating factor for D-ornithine aminomutase [Candidatus Ozemobacter sibiricus]|uniref:Putative reactivating factor for D-ornithine aminomutase n=1 Tax=Candidatus Ozemobacter sibiricus TaxID=2268124 RepID=A0A367ZJV8_9BACT|nr:MAG: putative reactivating factor for D-ornithine aminomutase [Candidatus Ozemobacter sibiricus]
MAREIDILTIEVGSTITKANAFLRDPASGGLRHVGQGFAPTTVALGDVGIGVRGALAELQHTSRRSKEGAEVFVNSSAAGGLRMTVHGLTYNMTARAAREASLGAGAIVKLVTAGRLAPTDLDEIRRIQPNLILLAGGVDFGARDTVLDNAADLARARFGVPVIYAGNAALVGAVRDLFAGSGSEVLVAPNVFPDVDVLNVDPLRTLIQDAFARHIIHAPGMDDLQRLTARPVLPTPGAVLKAAEIFADVLGDVVVFDVGGATTDVHSVTDGSPEFAARQTDPEPRAKRTVEGDLGVFVNARHIFELVADAQWQARADEVRAMPATEREREVTRWLCARAVEAGARRHAGTLHDLYTPTGRRQIVRGKDLTAVKWVIGTGGALTRVEGGAEILRSICTGPGKHLLPKPEAQILLDRTYLFSAMGTIADAYPEAVRAVFTDWARQAQTGSFCPS